MAYSVWSLGKPRGGFAAAQVRNHLIDKFSLPTAQADKVIGGRCRLKLTDDRNEAHRYARVLTGIGLLVEVRNDDTPATLSTAGPTNGATAAQAQATPVADHQPPPASTNAASAMPWNRSFPRAGPPRPIC